MDLHAGASLPLLAFQHHVGSMYIPPAALEFVCELGVGEFCLVEKARLRSQHPSEGSAHSGSTSGGGTAASSSNASAAMVKQQEEGQPASAAGGASAAAAEAVVVKSYVPHVIATPEDLRELLLEAGRLKWLSHPHLPAFLGLGCFYFNSLPEVRSSLFMVEEYAGARTLRKLIREQARTPLRHVYSWNEALRWSCELAEALAYLHEQSPAYVHADLRPDNVLITDGPLEGASVKLGDIKPHRHVYEQLPPMHKLAGEVLPGGQQLRQQQSLAQYASSSTRHQPVKEAGDIPSPVERTLSLSSALTATSQAKPIPTDASTRLRSHSSLPIISLKDSAALVEAAGAQAHVGAGRRGGGLASTLLPSTSLAVSPEPAGACALGGNGGSSAQHMRAPAAAQPERTAASAPPPLTSTAFEGSSLGGLNRSFSWDEPADSLALHLGGSGSLGLSGHASSGLNASASGGLTTGLGSASSLGASGGGAALAGAANGNDSQHGDSQHGGSHGMAYDLFADLSSPTSSPLDALSPLRASGVYTWAPGAAGPCRAAHVAVKAHVWEPELAPSRGGCESSSSGGSASGGAPRELESKQHGSSSAFAALTAIDTVLEEDDCSSITSEHPLAAAAGAPLQQHARSQQLPAHGAAAAPAGSEAAAALQSSLCPSSSAPAPITYEDASVSNSTHSGKKRVRFALARGAISVASRYWGLLYLAPEVQRGERPTEKVDVFAFGLTLLELLSRTLVADTQGLLGADESALAAHAARMADGWRPELPAFLPPALSELVRACWAQEPHERPRMAEVCERLRAAAADPAVLKALQGQLPPALQQLHAPPDLGCSCTIC